MVDSFFFNMNLSGFSVTLQVPLYVGSRSLFLKLCLSFCWLARREIIFCGYSIGVSKQTIRGYNIRGLGGKKYPPTSRVVAGPPLKIGLHLYQF